MPPEPLPWDRKELFRDRRHGHERSEPFGPVARWRDSSSYGGSRNNDFSPRWGFPSEFRRPPGHGRQGGWHMYPEDSAHGCPVARGSDRFLDDDGFRPSGPRGDGRYGKVYRENRSTFGQKDWRSHSWEANHHHSFLHNGPGRPNIINDQRSVGDSPMRASNPHSEPSVQFHSKDQAEKTSDVNGSRSSQRVDKENSLGSLDWKPLKWSRSGSLTSRGSGFSQSSSSKSIGESSDVKGELIPKNTTPVQSPSGDPVACASALVPSEEAASRKKPRLGWGEGLAKYEKKKVEGPEENLNKAGIAASPFKLESMHSLSSNLIDKSPRVTGFSDCSSPATPSSVACSSSPGLEDKTNGKVTDADGDGNNCSISSMPVSENLIESLHFSLEKLELNSIASLSSLLNELLQVDDQCPTDAGFVRSSALNKLLLWKGDISKALESTETEIDSLESELKTLKFDAGKSSLCPASSKSDDPQEDVNVFARPPALEVVSSGDMIVEEAVPDDNAEKSHNENKGGDIDSPGTATSKFAEPLSVKMKMTPNGWKGFASGDVGSVDSTKSTTENLPVCIDVDKTGGTCASDYGRLIPDGSLLTPVEHLSASDEQESNMRDSILASNKEICVRASEVFAKLLTSNHGAETMEANKALCLPSDLTIKEKFLRRKRLQKFKEKVISLKYRAFQHLWKEDLRLFSLRSQRTKPQKKFDLSSRLMQNGVPKHRSSIRSRFASPAGSLSLVPTAEIINFTRRLLSDSQVTIYRSNLKMPAMILDEKEKTFSRFISSNGLVEDPYAVEKERAMINPWTVEERDIFMDKLATHGKDFRLIASFLDHKTTADCIEFYYKNHKSECFDKTKKKMDLKKQGAPLSANTYLVTSGKKWSREMNAASLDILGAVSVIAAQADEAMETSKLLSGKSSIRKSRGYDGIIETSSSYEVAEDERETAAADVLAGICVSLSSEAMSSYITSSVVPGEGNHDGKHQKVGSSIRRPLTPDVTQNVEGDTCSGESCVEMDPVDWTDDEKSLFVQAFSSHGKDFSMISRFVRTKTRDQCKVFFSKARKCLGLDTVHPRTGNGGIPTSNDANGGGSDTEDACIVETGSVGCSDKSGTSVEDDLPQVNHDVSKPETVVTELNTLQQKCGPGEVDDHKDADTKPDDALPGDDHRAELSELALDGASIDDQDARSSAAADDIARCGVELINQDDTSEVEASAGVVAKDPEAVISLEKSVANFENGEVHASSAPVDIVTDRDGSCKPSTSTSEDDFHHPEPDGSVMDQGELSRDLKLDLSIKADSKGGVAQKAGLESKLQPFQACYLRKCSRASSSDSVAELPLLQKREDQTTLDIAGPSHSSKTQKSRGNGDVKLFGKILTKLSSVDKPTPSTQGDDQKANHYPISASEVDMNGNCNSTKHDHNSFLGLENVPIRSYGFWDGTKIQTGFSSLPDSALLLAKYPAAFSNYSISSSKTEEQQQQQQPLPLQAAVSTSECNINGACIFSPSEFNSSNGSVIDYPVYRNQEGVHPFRLDMKPRQDVFPELQRNGFEAVKLNVIQGGDVLVGGSCTGISDPVAALKLHYARTQQYGSGGGGGGDSGGGNGVIREDSWRGQGDVGR